VERGESHPTMTISGAEVRSELERVVASRSFQRSPQMQRFLRFLVEEALSGRRDRLKEYVVATEVFGRPADYDPRLDSLVRVEAHRLRNLLHAHYSNAGSKDGVVIDLSKGSYVPVFRHRNHDESVPLAVPTVERFHPRRLWLVIAAVATLGLLAALAYYLTVPTPLRLPPNPTIAVLPFDNLSTDPENAYFCFGLMDQITADLAKAGGTRVVARTSSSRFKRGDDIAAIGRQLKADAVLEGSVQRSDGHIRVTAQLINTASSLHIWSDSYERTGPDFLRAQDEIAVAISNAMRLHLTGNSAIEPHRSAFSSDAEANRLYWKGAYFRAPMGKTGWRKDLAASADYLEQAVRRDPQFALAYAVLADVYVSMAWERGGGPVTSDLMTRGRQAAERAVRLDNSLAEAHAALGTVQFFYDYNPEAAEKSFQQALQLDPSNGKARMWYAMALVMQRRSEDAIAQARQAKDLDPMSYVATTHLGVVTYFSRHNDEAIALVRETLQVANIAPAHGLLGMAYEAQKNYDAAIAEYQAGLQLVPNHPYIKGMMGHAYAMSGRKKEALALLKDHALGFDQGGLSDLKASYIYLALGDRDRALQLLERDYEQRDPELPYINADPVFDPIREDPRFIAILRKMRLAQ
jgi:TolB-like protein/Flp pilus assembly protein TadD